MPQAEVDSLIDAYLNGELDDAGREALASALESDASAARAFDAALRMEALLNAAHADGAAQAGEAARLKARLAARRLRTAEPARPVQLPRPAPARAWMAVAAVVALMFGSAIYLKNQNGPVKSGGVSSVGGASSGQNSIASDQPKNDSRELKNPPPEPPPRPREFRGPEDRPFPPPPRPPREDVCDTALNHADELQLSGEQRKFLQDIRAEHDERRARADLDPQLRKLNDALRDARKTRDEKKAAVLSKELHDYETALMGNMKPGRNPMDVLNEGQRRKLDGILDRKRPENPPPPPRDGDMPPPPPPRGRPPPLP